MPKIGQGRTVSEIAAERPPSVKTVSTSRARILDKMGMRTSAELMRYVIAHKLVPLTAVTNALRGARPAEAGDCSHKRRRVDGLG